MTLKDQIINSALFVRHKWLTLLFSLFLVIGLGAGAQHLYFNPSYKTYFAEDNAQRVDFESIQQEFTRSDNLLFVLTAPGETIYDQEFLTAVGWLTEKAWTLPKALRVDSLTNFQHTIADEDDLLVEDLVYTGSTLSHEQLKSIESIALSDPLLRNLVVKEGSRSTGVNVTMNVDESDPADYSRIASAARELRQELQALYPDVEVRLSGSVMLGETFSVAAQEDGQTIVPIMYLVILVITWLTLRSLLATFATLVIVILSTITCLGVAGLLGFYFTSVSALVPTIVLTLAVADSIHILKTMKELMASGVEKKQAITDSMALNHKPVFLTSLTTILGFLGLNFSAVPNYHDLGNMTAIGVAFAYLFSVTTLPALMAILPLKVKPRAQQGVKKTDVFTHFVKRHASPIILVTGLGFIASLFMIPKMEAYDEPIKYFSESMEFRQDTDYTVENLTGVQTIQLALPAREGSVADPNYLAELDQLKGFIENQPGVAHVAVLSDTLKRLNKSMHGDDPAYYRLPDNQELAAQYLLLYELSLPRGLDLGNTLNLEKSASRLSITLTDANTRRIIEVSENIFQWIKENTRAIEKPVAGSTDLMFSHISKTNIDSMVAGTSITFLLITLSIMLALRSFRYGLLSVATNVLPSIMAFGIWAVTVTKADMAVAIAATATIGIIVDFSVHFLAKYSKFRKDRGTEEALHQTITVVAPPILCTAVILAGGFSVLVLSQFRLNLVLGALSALTIVMATLAVFLVLPALLAKFDNKHV